MGTARLYTVWRFESPTSGEVKIVPRYTEPDDKLYQHAYQQVLWQGWANGKEQAILLAGVK